jgi:hypothetical protein
MIDKSPLRNVRRNNYAELRQLIEHTHTWRQKKNRGRLQCFSHTSAYNLQLDDNGNIVFGMRWYYMHEEPSDATEKLLWTLDANNVYTLLPEAKEFNIHYSYVIAMRRSTPFYVSNHTINGVHQVVVWTKSRQVWRYVPGMRITRPGDVLGGVPFARPKVDREKVRQFRFLGQWFKDAKAMAQFDTRTRTEHGEAVEDGLKLQHWGLADAAKCIVADPTNNFELFSLVLMSRRWLGLFYGRPDAHLSINDQLISQYRSLRERILQQAGVYTLPYEV